MPIARCNNIDICYETLGDPRGRPLFLIMGLARQLIHWPAPLCEGLAARGHYVVRFDNRDMGESTSFEAAGAPDFGAVVAALKAGQPPPVAYTLADMASDTLGLMDALEIPAAHLAGVSLGGMIAQTAAILHPERVLTLTSLLSTTGRPGLPHASAEGAQLLAKRAPAERDAFIEFSVERDRILTGPHMPFDPQVARAVAAQSHDRGHPYTGPSRQMAAATAYGPRHERLKQVTTPSLVVHGDADPLFDVACGRDTADCLPNARFVSIPGLGHSLPQPIWDTLIEEISALTRGLPAPGNPAPG